MRSSGQPAAPPRAKARCSGELAQSGERLVCNQEVTGSSPVFSRVSPERPLTQRPLRVGAGRRSRHGCDPPTPPGSGRRSNSGRNPFHNGSVWQFQGACSADGERTTKDPPPLSGGARLRGQVTKGARWMPWRRKAMKDVADCDKPRGAVSRLRSGDFRMG